MAIPMCACLLLRSKVMGFSTTQFNGVFRVINGVLVVVLFLVIAFVVASKGEVRASSHTLADAQATLVNATNRAEAAAVAFNDIRAVNEAQLRRAIDVATSEALNVLESSLDADLRTYAIEESVRQLRVQNTFDREAVRNIVATEVGKVMGITGDVVRSGIGDNTADVLSVISQMDARLVDAQAMFAEATTIMQTLRGKLAGLTSPSVAELRAQIENVAGIDGFSSAISANIPLLQAQIGRLSGAFVEDSLLISLPFVEEVAAQAAPYLESITGNLIGITGRTAGVGGSGGGTPFGGRSLAVRYCTCSGGVAVLINDLKIPYTGPKWLLFQPGVSRLYPFYQIYRVGVWTLGLWRPGGICLYWAGKSCAYLPVQGTMVMVGTSK